VVRALDKKLVRDVMRLRGQVITIALVVACGIAGYVAVVGTYRSLEQARDAYYDRQRFAHVFADVIVAPKSLVARIERVPGVTQVATRLRKPIRVPLAELTEPARGEILSVDVARAQGLDALVLGEGRWPERGSTEEVLVIDQFASARKLRIGERLPLVLEGMRLSPRVVGVARSPDYVFPIAPGEIAFDPSRVPVLWMDESALARALHLDGAFTHVSARLQPGASRSAAIEALDRLLEPYGGTPAFGRDKHPSNALLDGELAQLSSMATTIPLIFLGVAAFLVNVVLSRLVQLDRPEIAALKAMGYRDRALGRHYIELVALIVSLGAALGLGLGLYFGNAITRLYARYFGFPNLSFTLDVALFVQAVAISLVAALVGALVSARAVTRLRPAEAMRPPQPLRYRKGLFVREKVAHLLGASATMVGRELLRRPLRLLLSSLGIAMAVAVLVVGRYSADAIDHLVTLQFRTAQREDLAVSFTHALPARALHALSRLPGVTRVEGTRSLGVRVRHGHALRLAVLSGSSRDSTLRRLVDSQGVIHMPPEEGVMLTRKLAEVLGVRPGDKVMIETLERERRSREAVVSATVDDTFGMSIYMEASALARWLGEERLVPGAVLKIEDGTYAGVLQRLTRLPAVLGISRRTSVFELFEQQSAEQMRIMTMTLTVFALIIAAGVVYNNARVSLSMRARDLASLRVVGFRRAEISTILLSELAVQTLLGLVPGMWLGRVLVASVAGAADPELYRFPLVISERTYAFAVSMTLAAALASALLVRRRLDQLDLIAVLKTRE
jgi:putative ABC transport system permease protein